MHIHKNLISSESQISSFQKLCQWDKGKKNVYIDKVSEKKRSIYEFMCVCVCVCVYTYIHVNIHTLIIKIYNYDTMTQRVQITIPPYQHYG